MSAIIRNTDNLSVPSLTGTVNQELSQNTAHLSHRQQNLSMPEASTGIANHRQEIRQFESPVSRPQRLDGIEETLPSPDVFSTNSNSFKTNLEVNDYQNVVWSNNLINKRTNADINSLIGNTMVRLKPLLQLLKAHYD